MSIKLLVNGFFRSGTTIVWKIFRDSNPGIVSFYEPCHEEIMSRLDSFAKEPFTDTLHNVSVWDEYFEVAGLIDQIRQNHPNTGKGNIFPCEARDVVNYAKVYDALDGDVILQTNRWALFMEDIHKALGTPIMHITRNPLDVYRSMQNVYFTQGSLAKNLIKKNFKNHFAKKAFGILNMYEYVSRRFSRPARKRRTKLETEFNSVAFDMFFIVWSISNYYAIKAMDNGKGTALTYETMLKYPFETQKTIEEKFGLAFNHEGILKPPTRKTFLTGEEQELLLKTAEELNVYDEFFYVAKNADS